MRGHAAQSWSVPGAALILCIWLFPGSLANSWEGRLAIYILPFALARAAVMFVLWRVRNKDADRLAGDLNQARMLLEQREHERDLAQEELFRRLYEERELNKEKAQFQSQLAEYEKYAALAQLALGAAHEINNPLLGILSHLELELKDAADPEE